MNIFKDLLSDMFPENFTCEICGREIFDGAYFCKKCSEKVIVNDKTTCPLCGRRTKVNELCLDCKAYTPLFDRAVSALVYDGGAITLINKFKRDCGYLKEYFARLLAGKCANFSDADAVCYVPMTTKEYKKRGYNQAKLIADSLAEKINKPVMDGALIKFKQTAEQKELSRSERMKNLQGCFKADKSVFGKTLILVDDVLTTGATANAVCQALKKAGAKKIYFATAASVEYKKDI